MKVTQLGKSDLAVSRVGLGCNNFGSRLDLAGARTVVDAAIAAGIMFFDTADVYGSGESERFLGEVLAARRDEVLLATKFGSMQHADGDDPGGSRASVHRAIDASLQRLATGHVDLYYYHRPDGITPIVETVAAMHELVESGKVRWLGLSNVNAAQIAEAIEFDSAGPARIVAVQNHYSLMHRVDDADVLPLCRKLEIGYIPFFPLESGLLTGKYRENAPAPVGARLSNSDDGRLSTERLRHVGALEDFAARRGHTVLELAIGGLASIPGIPTVIAGAMSAEQVLSNAAAGDWRLTDAELLDLESVRGRRSAR